MVTDLGYGRGWAAGEAAASIFRIDQQLGRPLQITEAGRSAADADANYARRQAYENGTGPWAPLALPSWLSVHCKGYAIDTNDWYDPNTAAVLRANGWLQTARYADPNTDEPWHGEYDRSRDQHLNDAGGKNSATINPSEEDDMYDDNKHREVLTAARPIKLFRMGTGVVAVGAGGGFWVIPSEAYLQLLIAWEIAGPNIVARTIDENELTAMRNLLQTMNPGGDGTPGQKVDAVLKLTDEDAKRIASQISGTVAGDVANEIGTRLAPKA